MPSPLTRDEQRRIALLSAPFALSLVANTVGAALVPVLLVKTPLALVALSPLVRHLLIAAPSIDAAPFFAVAAPRMFVVDPFMYLLGREFGDRAVEAVATRFGGTMIRQLDETARRASWLMVLLWPDPLVCMLAGASRLDPRLFVTLNLLGTLGILTLIRASAAALSGPLGSLRAFFESNTLGTTIVMSIAVLGAFALRQLARSKTDEGGPPPLALAFSLSRLAP